MIAFKYKAVDSAGQPAKGLIHALDDHDAARRLAASGLTPLSAGSTSSSAKTPGTLTLTPNS